MGGVAEAVQDLRGAGARARRERAGKEAKVAQVDLGDPDLCASLLPGVLPDLRREWAALLAGEDVAVVARLGERSRWLFRSVTSASGMARTRQPTSDEVDVPAAHSEDLA